MGRALAVEDRRELSHEIGHLIAEEFQRRGHPLPEPTKP